MLSSENMANSGEKSDFFQKIAVRESDLKSVVESLLSSLSAKQKLVLTSRFGIGNGEPKTLEAIGKSLNVTRERIRQIEADAVKALRKSERKKYAGDIVSLANDITKEYGGIISIGRLTKELLSRHSGKSEHSPLEARVTEIIFLLAGLRKMKSNRETVDAWTSSDFDKKYFQAAVLELEAIFDATKRILNLEEILKKLDHSDFKNRFPQLKPEHVVSFLEVSKKFDRNVFDDWGKSKWPLIKPRGVREKATLVLLKKNHPLHFREIAKFIEEMKLSEKKVHPQTVHNELIRDKRFVLVGRGTYALREWGYEEGTVKDVIVNLLKSAGGFLDKEKIYQGVFKKRKVKKATVAVNLADKKLFEKREGGYQLKTS
jgi:hypothetical protein